MRRRVLLYLTLISVSACTGTDTTQPGLEHATSPNYSISDGNNHNGNPDFFFLPPMVKNPAGSAEWSAGAFNATLRPQVEICDLVASSEAAAAVAPCHATTSYPASLSGDEQYTYNWKVPNDAAVTYYRISVRVGSRPPLGFADVETGANGGALKNVTTGEFVPLVDGRTLPIKFRIERYALCEVPGQPTCATGSVDLGTGGTVSTSLTNTGLQSGITLPPQPPPSNGAPSTVTVTVQGCGDFHARDLTDLPTFGPCMRVVVEPALSGPLAKQALVFSCDVTETAVHDGVVDHEQAERIALHRLTPRGALEALPHARPQCGSPVAATGSLRGMFAALVHFDVKAAAREAVSMLAPRPLYAATRFIDLGGGGGTFLGDAGDASFSRSSTTTARFSLTDGGPSATINEFQFALPSKFQVGEAPGFEGFAGSVLKRSVQVTDLGGVPVSGARVRFSTDDGTLSSASEHTVGGTAGVDWTLGSAGGLATLTATGRGIAGTDVSGPREGIDPFQPIDPHWDGTDASVGPAIRLGVGSVKFTATKLVTGFEPPDAPWTLGGFWQASALIGVSNAAYPTLVALPAGATSNALPTPYVGRQALWFGNTGDGNYAGTLLNGDAGGTSTERRFGTAASPVFTVPAAGTVNLAFRSWFEIEAVNSANYDVMTVSVQDVASGVITVVRRLNPASDPDAPARVPFTSGGLNRPPVWTLESVNISDYAGQRIRVLFTFDTGDNLYNGFRGWIVDDVTLTPGLAASASRIPLTRTFDVVPTNTPPARTYRP